MHLRKRISGIVIQGAKNLFNQGFVRDAKSFHLNPPLPRQTGSSTTQMTGKLQVPFKQKVELWNHVVQGMDPKVIPKQASTLLSSPIVLSKQQADILFEFEPDVREYILKLWMPLEKHALEHQPLFNELIEMIHKEKDLWANYKKMPFNLAAQFNWLNALNIFNEDNFKKIIHSPIKMQCVLNILMCMKNKNILNGDSSIYQYYLNKLMTVSAPQLDALDEALQAGPYKTKSQIDVLLTIPDHLSELCPIHTFLFSHGWLTTDRLRRYDYSESADAILHILQVPGASENTFDELVKNHQMASSVWAILESFKSEVPLQKALLPLLLDHLDQLSLIYKKLPVIKQILSSMDLTNADVSLKILFTDINKLDNLAELINVSPALLKDMTPEVLSLTLQHIQGAPEEEISHGVKLRF